MKRAFLGWLAAAVVAGCGGNVVVDASGTSIGGGGGGGGSGGAAPVKICGGKQGLQCGADEWCQWDPPTTCGNADGTGVCQPRPTTCSDSCGTVATCGCDGLPYCNPCEANAAGFDVGSALSCAFTNTDEYAAFSLPTNAPRYAITKTEHVADRCVVVVMAGFPMSSFPGIQTTMGWSVESIGITEHAQDCALGGGLWPAPPGLVKADMAKGIVKQDNSGWPCVVSIDIAIAFPPGSPAWVPSQESMMASDLVLDDGAGCPL